ncbi:hypothetical protein H6G20_04255 [Desertifilum sp. FACHB-1129]|uniref:Uncharacterized protein n=2 Tax=Cyanophyceae TaxID=3028117 RepID=A0A1E5QRI4_9CYAN|nr:MULTISPECIES: hypothetical protein [Cyanophyceae]MCD8487340.1 hypothetical protein [Desertifilum sp.]MDA0208695.1 hypothetical protein [Cyanobacteria bacterium FC1]MDI9640373.1 hypothetical protein [Geitlerinema splendidum]MDK3155576.1 hypothetical protein [Kamptonema cortianum]MDL5044748.1 hypothetical protein [Oscillatoria amoena NRMC-F 0135]
MPVKKSHYESLLAEYSNQDLAIALLKQHRPYLEMLPSMRRPEESLISIPLPVVRLRPSSHRHQNANTPEGLTTLPCDVSLILCDPEWKIKTGPEIFIFIHRPHEDFSDFLGRWRQTQVWLDQGYEWLMPPRYKHILSEEAEEICPLFVVFPETPERIKRGLQGAYLPYVVKALSASVEEPTAETLSTEDSLLEE